MRPYLKLFWSAFPISPYSVGMRKNTDQKNSEYEQLSSNWVGGRKVDEKSDKKSQRKEGCTAKMITLTKILFSYVLFSVT